MWVCVGVGGCLCVFYLVEVSLVIINGSQFFITVAQVRVDVCGCGCVWVWVVVLCVFYLVESVCL